MRKEVIEQHIDKVCKEKNIENPLDKAFNYGVLIADQKKSSHQQFSEQCQ